MHLQLLQGSASWGVSALQSTHILKAAVDSGAHAAGCGSGGRAVEGGPHFEDVT